MYPTTAGGNRGPNQKLSMSVSERLGPRRNFAANNYDEIGSNSSYSTYAPQVATDDTSTTTITTTATYRKPNRNITTWPNEIFSLENSHEKWWLVEPLKCIDLSFNLIPNIPPQINQFIDSLIELRLMNNCLLSIPNELTELINLKILDLSKNKITTIPATLGSCTNLVELNLSSNQLTTLPLLISSNNNNNNAPILSSLSRLEICNLADNRLTTLADNWFNGMKNLRTINLGNNLLTSLPLSLSSCSQLKTINISRCQLQTIPRNYFYNLSALEFIDARQNMLEELPILPNNTVISEIYFGFNRIQRIDPSSIVRSSLTVIDIADNQIHEIPDDLRNCIRLMTFDISNNDINNLPAWLGFLPQLVRIVIEGNPLRSMKRSFLGTHVNISALKQYFKTRATPEEVSLWEREIQAGGSIKFAAQYNNNTMTTPNSGGTNPTSNQPYSQHTKNNNNSGYISSSNSTIPTYSSTEQPMHIPSSTSASTSLLTYKSATETAKTLDYTDHYTQSWEYVCREVMNTNGKLILSKDLFPNKLTTINPNDLAKWNKNGINIMQKITNFIGDYQSFQDTNTLLGLPLNLCTQIFPNLYEISLMYNNLTKIPKALTNSCLTTSINGYCNLHTLKLSNNQITNHGLDWLPSSIQYLDLRHNQLTNIPNTLWTLNKLHTLLLGYNQISIYIPPPSTNNAPTRLRIHSDDDLLYIPSLTTLDLSNNQLQRLPVSILSLLNLESLDISHNDLSIIPVHLGNLPKLLSLNIDNNPQRSIRYNILEKGSNQLVSYLKSRIPVGEEILYFEAYRNVLPGGVHNTSSTANLNTNISNYTNATSTITATSTTTHNGSFINDTTTNYGNMNNNYGSNNNNNPNYGNNQQQFLPLSSSYTNTVSNRTMSNPVLYNTNVMNTSNNNNNYVTTSSSIVQPSTNNIINNNNNNDLSHANILRRIDTIANEIQLGRLTTAQLLVAKKELALLRAAEIRARGSSL